MFIGILDWFRHNLFTFLSLNFDILRILQFIQCLKVFFITISNILMRLNVIFYKCFRTKNVFIVLSFVRYYLLTVKQPLTLINLSIFYMPCNSYATLCMLDATFCARSWPHLNWCNMCMLGFCKQILKRIINDCFWNFLYLNFSP